MHDDQSGSGASFSHFRNRPPALPLWAAGGRVTDWRGSYGAGRRRLRGTARAVASAPLAIFFEKPIRRRVNQFVALIHPALAGVEVRMLGPVRLLATVFEGVPGSAAGRRRAVRD